MSEHRLNKYRHGILSTSNSIPLYTLCGLQGTRWYVLLEPETFVSKTGAEPTCPVCSKVIKTLIIAYQARVIKEQTKSKSVTLKATTASAAQFKVCIKEFTIAAINLQETLAIKKK